MKARIWRRFAIAFGFVSAFANSPCESSFADDTELRARAFLAREVPRWNRENHCFSCHNNGDGARALVLVASEDKHDLAETLEFLSHPDRWKKNGVDAVFSDKRLARLQFALALEAAFEAKRIPDRTPLIEAAKMLADDQAEDGSWPIDDAAPVGSPATYGPPLATSMAVQTLRNADSKRFRKTIEKAESWFRKRPIQNVLDASSVLLVMSSKSDGKLVLDAKDFLKNSQNDDGGWGPFRDSASEPFDTALALLGLAKLTDADVKALNQKGRDYLATIQKEDGSWTETTRPAGGESYAQRISTTSWATMALFATRPERLKASAPKP